MIVRIVPLVVGSLLLVATDRDGIDTARPTAPHSGRYVDLVGRSAELVPALERNACHAGWTYRTSIDGDRREAPDPQFLTDGDATTGIELASTDRALEVRFISGSRWINQVQLTTNLEALDIELLDPAGAWRFFARASAPDGPLQAVTLDGPALHASAIRLLVPIADRSPVGRVSELAARWVGVDPDDAKPAHGSAPGGNPNELFSEAINLYSPDAPDFENLRNAKRDVHGLAERLLTKDWNHVGYVDRHAWEEDFKAAAHGGTEQTYPDRYDMAYFSGHGDADGNDTILGAPRTGHLVFGVEGRTHDDPLLFPGEASGAWGNDDLEWMVFAACLTQATPQTRARWSSTMAGLHLILGFETSMADSARHGGYFGYGLCGTWTAGWTIKQSWFFAADKTQNRRKTRIQWVLGEDGAVGEDHIWGQGSVVVPDPVPDNTFNFWSQTSHVAQAAPASSAASAPGIRLGGASSAPAVWIDSGLFRIAESRGQMQMRVYHVLQVTVDAAYVQSIAQDICDSAGVLCSGAVGQQDPVHLSMGEGVHQLHVCQTTGAFHYLNTDTWLAQLDRAPRLLDESEAASAASQLLADWQRLPADSAVAFVQYLAQGQATIVGGEPIEDPARTFDTANRVVYERRLGDTGEFPVFGPGGTMVVELGNAGAVQRVLEGAWRPLSSGTLVSILPPLDVLNFFAAQGPQATISPHRWIEESIEVEGWELGYYEFPCDVNQTKLRPVYRIDTTVTLSPLGQEPPEQVEADYFLWADSLPPVVDITSSTSEGCVDVGEEVCLTATASGGQPPFTYEWFDADGELIGTTAQVCVTIPAVDPVKNEPDRSYQVIVTDALGSSNFQIESICVAGDAYPGQVMLPITLAKLGSQVVISWAPSCSTDASDYGIYEGSLSSLGTGIYDHVGIDCADAPPFFQEIVATAETGSYYIVVPRTHGHEGSYGRDSAGHERPPAVSAESRCAEFTLGTCP